MARGDGEREEAWPDEAEVARSDWCRAVRGSKSKTGARREAEVGEGGEGRGEDDDGASGEDKDSGFTIIAGQGKKEVVGAGSCRAETEPQGEERGLETTPQYGPEPLKPGWMFLLARSSCEDWVRTSKGHAGGSRPLASPAKAMGCEDSSDAGLGGPRVRPELGNNEGV